MTNTGGREKVRTVKSGTWSCSRCGMDIEVGQFYEHEAAPESGMRHTHCPKRRR